MITLSEDLEEIVRHIGTLKTVKELEGYYGSLSHEVQNNRLIKNLIDKRKTMVKQ